MFLPGKLFGDGHGGSGSQTGHGREKTPKPFGILIYRVEWIAGAGLHFVLRHAGAERLRQIVPEFVQPAAAHFQYTARRYRMAWLGPETTRSRASSDTFFLYAKACRARPMRRESRQCHAPESQNVPEPQSRRAA